MSPASAPPVVVIAGASSGIGRLTARRFAERGARVVLAARGEAALHAAAREVEQSGGQALTVVTDVADAAQVDRLAHAAVERFGRIDTWVQTAAVTEYATVEQMTAEEFARIVHVNLLGSVHAAKAVLPQMRRQGGGTLVLISSGLGVRSVPLQSAYCASKAAVRAFAESLRMELAADGPQVAVTVLLPASIDTPLFRHARSKLGVVPKPLPPVYDPEVAAASIVFAADHPRREIVVGGAAKVLTAAQRVSPGLLDHALVARRAGFRQQATDEADDGRDNLFSPSEAGDGLRGHYGHRRLGRSVYTRLFEHHPAARRLVLAAAGLAATRLVGRT